MFVDSCLIMWYDKARRCCSFNFRGTERKSIVYAKNLIYIMNIKFKKQSYTALYNIIDKFYAEDKNDFIANLASDMCPGTFKDSNSADPAVYEDFLDCLNFCFAETDKIDVTTAFKAAIRFLEMYRDEFGFEINDYIERITFELYEREFEQVEEYA